MHICGSSFKVCL